MVVRGLILDFDGLIADSEVFWLRALRRLYKRHGTTLGYDRWLRGVGVGLDSFDPFQELADQSGARRCDLETEGEALFRRMMLGSRPMPGVTRLIRAAGIRGLTLAIASSSRFESVDPFLAGYRIRRHFAHIVTAEQVARLKPAPDLYLRALQKLGLGPQEAIAFEDSMPGLTAARAAGIRCVVVPNAATRHGAFTGAHLVTDSLRDLDIGALLGPAAVRTARPPAPRR
jgi:HAD superfamily hydrolase (TIGR01509 family)